MMDALIVGGLIVVAASNTWRSTTPVTLTPSGEVEQGGEVGAPGEVEQRDGAIELAVSGVFYAGCNEVRALGKAPLYSGDPGYRAEMDGDSDGIACEPYR